MRLARISIETRLRTRSWSIFISPPAFFLLRKEKARTWNKAFHPLLVEVKVSPVIWIMISAGTYLIMAMVPPCCKSRWSSSPFPSSPQWTAWLPQGMGSEIHFRQLTHISEIALDWSQRFHVIVDFKSRILRFTFTSSTEGKPPRKESPPPWDISDLTSQHSLLFCLLKYLLFCLGARKHVFRVTHAVLGSLRWTLQYNALGPPHHQTSLLNSEKICSPDTFGRTPSCFQNLQCSHPVNKIGLS